MGCLALLALPALLIAEGYVFLAVGEAIGWLWAILALVASMSIGGSLVRMAGLQAMTRARDAMNRGEAPTRSLFDGACVLAAGALFVFPGFLTDGLAILLLLPPVRWVLIRLLGGVVRRRGAASAGAPQAGPAGRAFAGGPHVFVWASTSGFGTPPRPSPPTAAGPDGVIDAEWTEVPDSIGEGGQRGLPAGDVEASKRS